MEMAILKNFCNRRRKGADQFQHLARASERFDREQAQKLSTYEKRKESRHSRFLFTGRPISNESIQT